MEVDPFGLWVWWWTKIVGNPQSTGTLGHAFVSRVYAHINAMNPNVSRVTMDLGYKRLLDGGTFRYGPRPDVGVLYKNQTVKIVEVASRTDRNYFARKGIAGRNIVHMRKNGIAGSVKVSELAKRFDAAVSKVKGWFCR